MSNQNIPEPSRSLPERPSLRHLKDQAKDLVRTGDVLSLTQAQHRIAKLYGFASWPKLKSHIESLTRVGHLKRAIDTNDIEQVKSLMTSYPSLHTAPLGYGNDGPLTWAAECRVPRERPSPTRLAIAAWMIEHGSDVHQGGDAPLMRAALEGERIPMMELLVRHGANVNANWHGHFPIIFAACEALDPVALEWLLDHGADPNCASSPNRDTALDYLIAGYVRSSELTTCIDLLTTAGARTRYNLPGILETIQDDTARLSALIDSNPEIVRRSFPELDCGATAARGLLLTGGTLLHVAAEYGSVKAAKLLLERGADVNARASLAGTAGGQTPIFHAVTQYHDYGLAIATLLLQEGADLAVQATVRGQYDKPDEFLPCSPLTYALQFPGSDWPDANAKTISLLRGHRAVE
jgi:ankyrin repeat protein